MPRSRGRKKKPGSNAPRLPDDFRRRFGGQEAVQVVRTLLEDARKGLTIGPFTDHKGANHTLTFVVGEPLTDEQIVTLDGFLTGLAEAVRDLLEESDWLANHHDKGMEILEGARAEFVKLDKRFAVMEGKLDRKEKQLAEAKREIASAQKRGEESCEAVRASVRDWADKWRQLAPEWPGWAELEEALHG